MKAERSFSYALFVPEYIVVHDGSPRDSTAKNYYVKYKDYIKMWRPAKFMPPARKYDSGKRSCDYVFYAQSRLYRMV